MISALDVGEWSASRPVRFTPWEGPLGIHSIGDRVGPEPVWTQETATMRKDQNCYSGYKLWGICVYVNTCNNSVALSW
jgi:hypothetical protein